MTKRTHRTVKGTRKLRPSRAGFSAFETLESRELLSASALPNPPMTPAFRSGSSDVILRPMSSPTPPSGSTSPAQMRRFYAADNINFGGVPGDGRGMTIAIVDAFDLPTVYSDLQQFDQYYGLPDPPSFQKLDQLGGTNYPAADTKGGWGVEIALDVQWAHAMAPLANIVLVEADSAFTSDLFQGVQTAASLNNVVCISMSFGTPEQAGEIGWDSTFTTPVGHGGITYLAATGDAGSPGTYPAYSPNVVAVGGTAITYDADGNYGSETGWSGSGGGTSTQESRPAYQALVNPTATRRTIPDISMDAQPTTGVAIYDTYDFTVANPWAKYGGTSLATPMAAGLVAIADQGRVSVGQSRLDGRTQTLPALYAAPLNNFHDVLTGSNGGFSAGVGYDQVTGIGTPVANKLVNTLAGATASLPQINGTSGADNFTLTLNPNHLYVNWTDGTLSGQVAVVDLAGLTINGGGGNDTITFDYSNGNPLPNLLNLNGIFTLNGLSGSNPFAGKTVDLNRSTAYINYGSGPDPVAAVRQYLVNGYNGGAWNGSHGALSGSFVSSAAALDANHLSALGYADGADGVIVGQPAGTVEVRYTIVGDTDLDGTVGLTDYTAVVRGFAGGSAWDQGDTNYSGAVTLDDYTAVVRNYGQSASPGALPGAAPAALVAAPTGGGTVDSSELVTKRIPAVAGPRGTAARADKSSRRGGSDARLSAVVPVSAGAVVPRVESAAFPPVVEASRLKRLLKLA